MTINCILIFPIKNKEVDLLRSSESRLALLALDLFFKFMELYILQTII